ncbi:hypothetical protein Tco_1133769 [Tanacetum coccineum]
MERSQFGAIKIGASVVYLFNVWKARIAVMEDEWSYSSQGVWVIVGIFEKPWNDRVGVFTPLKMVVLNGRGSFGKKFPRPEVRPNDFHRASQPGSERLLTYIVGNCLEHCKSRKACDGRQMFRFMGSKSSLF